MRELMLPFQLCDISVMAGDGTNDGTRRESISEPPNIIESVSVFIDDVVDMASSPCVLAKRLNFLCRYLSDELIELWLIIGAVWASSTRFSAL